MEKILILLGILMFFSMFAFSKQTKKKMFARDRGKCQWPGCNKDWVDGWMLHSAHYNHDHNSPEYYDLDNGRMLCIEHHIADHQALYNRARTEAERNAQAYAIRQLRHLDEHNHLYYE
jgi:hypothetical protein